MNIELTTCAQYGHDAQTDINGYLFVVRLMADSYTKSGYLHKTEERDFCICVNCGVLYEATSREKRLFGKA